MHRVIIRPPLPIPEIIRPIVRSTRPEVTHPLPVMLVTHTSIPRLEDQPLPLETIAIILRPQFAGAIWTITECVGLLHLPATSLALATTALRTQLPILVPIHLRRPETMTDTIGAPLHPMTDMVATFPLLPL